MEKLTMAGGVALRYADFGTGDHTIVLLHGYLECMDIWEGFAGQLGRNQRVITLDLPGHGISETVGEIHTMEFLADTVKALLDKIGVTKCVMIGHSMGGYVTYVFAKKYPEYLSGMVLFHSSPDADTEDRKKLRDREIRAIEQGKKELLAQLNGGKQYAKENRKRLYDNIVGDEEQTMMTDNDGIVALLRGMRERDDMNDFVDSLTIPHMFIFGRGDELILPESGMETEARHPKSRVEWLEHSGHMGFVEERERSLEIIEDFIGTIGK